MTLPLVFLFLTILARVDSQAPLCYGFSSSYRAQFIGELVNDDQGLSGHVVATFQVQNFSHCFAECKKDCLCRSFNLPMSGQGTCELNDADKTTVVLARRRAWRYHHIETNITRPRSGECLKLYKNGCCSSNRCKNGANCTEHEGRGKPGFNCTCPDGFIGTLCERKIRSCLDYLWHNKNNPSGVHDIWTDGGAKFKVFCDMQPAVQEAWTLVMAHRLRSRGTFSSRPFFIDFPWSQHEPERSVFRLPVTFMESIAKGIGENRSAEWRVTCGYSFTEGNVTEDDIVRSRFKILNILTFTTNANSTCHRVDYINIRGKECYDCTVWATQTKSELFTINAHRGDEPNGCSFKSGSTVANENIFGVYHISNSTHDCAASPNSRTEYWFGGRL